MSVTIGHASIDENGNIHSGSAGDQTKKEVCVRTWYSMPWTSVIRPNRAAVAEKIARAMEQACANDNIGYDQYQRTTLYTQAKENNWDLSKITTKCETDCSALVAVCVNAAGIAVSKDIYTGNELQALKNTGEFVVFTSSSYTAKSDSLQRGDILLGKGHTAIVLSNSSTSSSSSSGSSTSLNKAIKWNGIVNTTKLNVRTFAGAENKTTSFSPLNKGDVIGVCDSVKDSKGAAWYYIVYNGKYGFVNSNYIQKQASNEKKIDNASSHSESLAGTYKTTADLNMRVGAGTNKEKVCVVPKGKEVVCYGYYTTVDNTKWCLVVYENYKGFVSSKYIMK